MTTITPARIRQINSEIEAALQSVASKYGVKISTGANKYSQTEYTTKLTVAAVSDNGAAMTAEAELFNQFMEAKGNEWRVGDTFSCFPRIKKAKITGYNPRSPKNSLQFEMNGQQYKAPMSLLEKAYKH